jgi:hypothetical protein
LWPNYKIRVWHIFLYLIASSSLLIFVAYIWFCTMYVVHTVDKFIHILIL